MAPLIAAGNFRLSVSRASTQRGFTYLAVLLLVLILTLNLGAASEYVATIKKREREAELVFVGEQYRNAIASYYLRSPGGNKQLPKTLDSLLLDSRSISTYRHLRKLYLDPITNTNNWGLVKTPQDEIVGVYSLSNERVLTTVNNPNFLHTVPMDEKQVSLEQSVYSDWKFVFKPDAQDQSIADPENQEESNDEADTEVKITLIE